MAMNLVSPLSMQLHVHQQMLYQQHRMALHHYQQDEITNTNGWSAMLNAPTAGPQLPDDVKVQLENKKLWQQFHAESTEMIITKSGRRMFPSVQLSVSGLERRSRYCVLLELAPASDRRHKYVGGSEAGRGTPRGWTSAGPAEPQPPVERRLYMHPDSPASGSHWMQHPLGFSKLKLTNNVVEHHSNVLLTSMHKYIPRIWIIRCDDVTSMRDLYNNPSSCFTFRETEFIAVTAYQNENITKLKIDNNPFAKGFRESGQSACKRKRQRPPHEDTGSSNSEISHDEEEGNVSSSDSDHNDHEAPLTKRSRHRETEENCCSVASTESKRNPTPPPVVPLRTEAVPRRETQPRLHRPWTDDGEEVTRIRPSGNPSQPPLHQHHHHPDYLGVQQAHYHLVALDLARMRHMQQRFAVAAQHLPPLMDFRQ
ncbi:PREDICTED: T-box-containing protein TBX6L-like [Ceratosolen solmsi marchali]|uniref:T-box-containing protein TBX6L-like n=1 Tax=Ceratosolen solmsi marchali TaxID=326594 RepID=A0AAJ6YX03_9HYME|nr:PREDICTED: T-box-containing protein TBX6L-like [Ceratosolen solmsi marchali]